MNYLQHVANPDATKLARQLAKLPNKEEAIRQAFLDALLNQDWSRVAALENSFETVELRTLARKLGALASRGFLVHRTDPSELAWRIPSGYEFGIAWLVVAPFVRTDSDYWSGQVIGEAFWRELDRSATPSIAWSSVPLCLAQATFGPTVRAILTKLVFEGQLDRLEDVIERAGQLYEEKFESERASGGKSPLAYFLWGCFVTGTNDASVLLDEQTWAPGLDVDAVAAAVTAQIAIASQEVEDETYIHPRVMSASDAYAFGIAMTTEQQALEGVAHYFDGEAGAVEALVSILEPNSLPYMDQLLISFWTKVGTCRYSYRMPRTDESPDEHAESVIEMLTRLGVASIRRVRPAARRGANEVHGWVVKPDGEWEKIDTARVGTAKRFITRWEWDTNEDVALDVHRHPRAYASKPALQLMEDIGATKVLQSHYQPAVGAAVMDALSRPGDPVMAIEGAILDQAGPDRDLAVALLRDEHEILVPLRPLAAAVQFRAAGGTIAVASDGLMAILDDLSIGDDCPMEMLRPAFDILYLRLRLAIPEGHDLRGDVLDGVLVQRFDGGQRLLLDGVVVEAHGKGVDEALPSDMVTLNVGVAVEATYGQALAQIDPADAFGREMFRLVAGFLMYMNSRDARSVDSPDLDRVRSRLGALARKKRKHDDYEELAASFNHIVIGPEQIPEEIQQIADLKRRGMKVHYRRGFVRHNQRWGPGRTLIRPVFIPPVLVNAKKLLPGEMPPPKKKYSVGSRRRLRPAVPKLGRAQ